MNINDSVTIKKLEIQNNIILLDIDCRLDIAKDNSFFFYHLC